MSLKGLSTDDLEWVREFVLNNPVMYKFLDNQDKEDKDILFHTDAKSESENTMFNYEEKLKIFSMKSLAKQEIKKYGVLTALFKNENVILAGGCFADFFHNKPPRDYDVFILDSNTHEQIEKEIKEIQAIIISSNFLRENPFYPNNNSNSHVLKVLNWDVGCVQLIFVDHKNIKELFDDFDFKHTRLGLSGGTDPRLHISRTAYDAIRDKKLVPHSQSAQLYPVDHYRIVKFKARGWSVPSNCI